MSQEELSQIGQSIFELSNYLSMSLGVPLLEDPLDLNFLYECLNAILGGLNPQWKNICFSGQSEEDFKLGEINLFKIAEQALLDEGQKLVEQNQEISEEHYLMLLEVMAQAAQAIKSQNLKEIYEKDQSPNKNKVKPREQPQKENTDNKKLKKDKQKTGLVKQTNIKKEKKKSSNSKSPLKNQKANPKRNVVNEVKRLEDQIIETIGKTMEKKYLQKAHPEREARIREKEGTQAVEKAKRHLDYAIKDYQLSKKVNIIKKYGVNSEKNGKKRNVADHAYMKMIQNKHRKLNEDLQNQQLKYYIQLRDKKVAYIRHIHQLIQKLERERQIDFNKQQRQIQTQKKKQILQKIQEVDQLFSSNMEKLQENYQKRKKIQELQNVGQIQVCRAMQKTMKQKKMKQLQDVKDLWEQQRNQLHKITTDQQKMKNKLIDIYRKYRI